MAKFWGTKFETAKVEAGTGMADKLSSHLCIWCLYIVANIHECFHCQCFSNVTWFEICFSLLGNRRFSSPALSVWHLLTAQTSLFGTEFLSFSVKCLLHFEERNHLSHYDWNAVLCRLPAYDLHNPRALSATYNIGPSKRTWETF